MARRVSALPGVTALTAVLTVGVALAADDTRTTVLAGGHEAPVVGVSANGEVIVSAGLDGRVLVWGVRDVLQTKDEAGKAVPPFQVFGPVMTGTDGGGTARAVPQLSVAAQPDGPLVASGGADGNVRVWLRNDRPRAELKQLVDGVPDFSKDEIRLAAMPPGDSAPDDHLVALAVGTAAGTDVWLLPRDLNPDPAPKKVVFKKDTEPKAKALSVARGLPAAGGTGFVPLALGVEGQVLVWTADPEQNGPDPVPVLRSPDALAIRSTGDGGANLRLVTASKQDGLARLWRVPVELPRQTVTLADASLVAAAANRIIGIIKLDDNSKKLTVWDAARAQVGQVEDSAAAQVKLLALSRDGSHVALITNDNKLRLWKPPKTNSTSGSNLEAGSADIPEDVTALAVHVGTEPEATVQVLAVSGRKLRLFTKLDLSTSKDLPGSGNIGLAAFDPDGGGVVLVDPERPRKPVHLGPDLEGAGNDFPELSADVTCLAAVPGADGGAGRLVAGLANGHVAILTYGNPITVTSDVTSGSSAVKSVAVSPDRERLAYADGSELHLGRLTEDGKLVELDAKTNVAATAVAVDNTAGGASFSYVVGANVSAWSPAALGVLSNAPASAKLAALDPRGSVLAVWAGTSDSDSSSGSAGPSKVRVVPLPDMPGGNAPAESTVEVPEGAEVSTLGFSRDGAIVIVGLVEDGGKRSRITFASTPRNPDPARNLPGQELKPGVSLTTTANPSPPRQAVGVGDNHRFGNDPALLTVSKEGLGLWLRRESTGPLQTASLFATDAPARPRSVHAVAWTPKEEDPVHLAACGSGGALKVFKLSGNGLTVAHTPDHPFPATLYALAYTGTTTPIIVTGGADGFVRLWDGNLKNSAFPAEEKDRHTRPVFGIGVAHRKPGLEPIDLIASISSDMTVRVWNTLNLSRLDKLELPDAPAAVAFIPDGTHLVVVDYSRNLLVWEIKDDGTPKSEDPPRTIPIFPDTGQTHTQSLSLTVVPPLGPGDPPRVAFPYDQTVGVVPP